MKEKIITLMGCLCLAIVNLSARSIVLTLKDGTHVYYLLGGESRPVLKFVDGNIVVNTDRYEFGDIKNFYISATDDPTYIEPAMEDKIQYSHNMVVVDTNTFSPINIYTSNGYKVDVSVQQFNGKSFIDLNPLPTGAYIVAIGETSLKILKK